MLVLDDNVLVFLVYLLKFYRDRLNEQSGFPTSRIKMPRKRHAPIPTSSILRLFELLYKRVYKFYATGFFSAFLALNFNKLGPFSLKKKNGGHFLRKSFNCDTLDFTQFFLYFGLIGKSL